MVETFTTIFDGIVFWALQVLGFIYHWYVWVFIHFLFYRFVSTKWTFELLGLKRWLICFVLLSFISTFTYVALQYVLINYSGLPVSLYMQNSSGHYYFQLIASAYSTFWGSVGLMLVIDYYKKYQLKSKDALELRVELSETNLKLLKMQLQPHFVFNTLNTTVTLIHEKPDDAEKMIVYLSDFLRKSLHQANKHLVTVNKEMSLLTDYFNIVRIRYEDQLKIVNKIEESALLAQIPPLLLQPLVENAIIHSLYSTTDQLELTLVIKQDSDFLYIMVMNNFREALLTEKKSGIGLKNTRRRLETLYGDDQELTYGITDEQLFKVEIKIPFQLERIDD